MSDIAIRYAVPADAGAIAAIYEPAVRHGTATFELEPPDAVEMLRRMTTVASDGYPWLVATRKDVVLGYAYAAAYRSRPAYRHTVENSIYVATLAQGMGVGRLLLDALLAECTERGFRQMIAVIGDSLQIGSIALHRSAGFTFCGTLHAVGFKNGRWLDSVLMQRALGEGETTPP